MNAIRFFLLIVLVSVLIGGTAGVALGIYQTTQEKETATADEAKSSQDQQKEKETDKEKEQHTEEPKAKEPPPPAADGKITAEEAARIARKQADGTIRKIEWEEEEDQAIYKVEIELSEEEKAKFEIDAHTGEILLAERD
ncbi:MAG: PepSY domain-containing protein [Firmicutes bacterium]|uniref:Uncharacterized membrane protein YkoI n=1 Tax=Melghirimyces thermohalophilus TaxID=1236220 RepID=A0A1G6PEZ7_9BACL|nr:PepSY domain-containing protein [Melghirimyces thermohalophilus]MDA8354221.1 PepSY domain-containing protein [Bacillota bacterium]SDC78096.1 Uncharacterized membrane protein YkoI [Melghirimyces thermohalophilus]